MNSVPSSEVGFTEQTLSVPSLHDKEDIVVAALQLSDLPDSVHSTLQCLYRWLG